MSETHIAAIVIWLSTMTAAVTLGVYGHPWLALAVLLAVPTLRSRTKTDDDGDDL